MASELEDLIRRLVSEEVSRQLQSFGIGKHALRYSPKVLPPGIGERRYRRTAQEMLAAGVAGVTLIRRGWIEVESASWTSFHSKKYHSQIPKPGPADSQVVAKWKADGRLRSTK